MKQIGRWEYFAFDQSLVRHVIGVHNFKILSDYLWMTNRKFPIFANVWIQAEDVNVFDLFAILSLIITRKNYSSCILILFIAFYLVIKHCCIRPSTEKSFSGIERFNNFDAVEKSCHFLILFQFGA